MHRDKCFSRACCSRTRSDGCKLKEAWPKLDIRKKIFTVRVMRLRFPRGGGCPVPGNVQDFNLVYLKLSLLIAGVLNRVPCGVPSLPTPTIPWYTEKTQFASTNYSLPSHVLTPHLLVWLDAAGTAVSPPDPCAGSCCRDCMAPSHVFRILCLPLEGF